MRGGYGSVRKITQDEIDAFSMLLHRLSFESEIP
jgi:hypothetical protein